MPLDVTKSLEDYVM